MTHTLRAWAVLADAERSRSMWESLDDGETADGRVLYAATLALLRAVGHVLQNVDGANPTSAKAVAAAYSALKTERASNAIYWDFITSERHAVLKEYRFGAEQIVGLELAYVDAAGVSRVDRVPFSLYLLDEGPFAGEDARDVAEQAIAFWEHHLADIELACLRGGA